MVYLVIIYYGDMSQTQWTANHLTLPPTLGVKVLRRGEMWCRGRCWWWSMQQVCLVCNTDWQPWVWRFKPISSPPAVSGGTSSNTQPCLLLPPASYNWWWRQRNDPLTRWQKKTKTMLRKHSPSSRIDTPLTYHRGQITGVRNFFLKWEEEGRWCCAVTVRLDMVSL